MSREVALSHTVPRLPCSLTHMIYAGQCSAAQLGSGSAQQCEGACTAALSTQREEAAYVKKWRLGPEGLVRAAEAVGSERIQGERVTAEYLYW